MKKIVLALFLIIFFSCKNEKAQPKTNIKPIQNKELIVRLGFKTNVKDEFKILLNNIKVDEFQKKNIQVRETVPPSSGFESIVANLGSDVNTRNLLIHLGKKEKTVVFNGIEFSYGNKNILVTKANFNKFLNTNKFLTLEDNGFVFSTKRINGKHNPAIIAKKKLLDSLFK
ncbi:hypothetical protein [Mangrovimonas spongiae]|uniref:Uncharacterized protein n=1 Tax=Mangrovimonas spongiae TaxID=2494697 RepID=A0A3R9MIZ9_9FLAO|nr:hypothetical protein [Mangrovimonas spongiae]RSK41513.1 hypothetical protein EJA19_01160 [Mangrovimonas spongiae]